MKLTVPESTDASKSLNCLNKKQIKLNVQKPTITSTSSSASNGDDNKEEDTHTDDVLQTLKGPYACPHKQRNPTNTPCQHDFTAFTTFQKHLDSHIQGKKGYTGSISDDFLVQIGSVVCQYCPKLVSIRYKIHINCRRKMLKKKKKSTPSPPVTVSLMYVSLYFLLHGLVIKLIS